MYVAMDVTSNEGGYAIGVADTLEGARAFCQEGREQPLVWDKDGCAGQSTVQYYEVKAFELNGGPL